MSQETNDNILSIFFNFNELVILFLKITGKYKTYQRNLSKLSCQKTMMLLVNVKIRCFLE